ncbi:MAG: MarR family winged helix-turn-helix transcriptional regulator [Jatrophihabitans sp.]
MTQSTRGEGSGAAAEVDRLVTALLTASRVLVGVSAQSLADVEDAVTLTQFRSLVVLDSHAEVNLNYLADQLGVNASTAMRTIDRLLAAGLVTRQDNPANRREVLLGLTPDGVSLVRRVTHRRRREIARIAAGMPASERTGLVRALRAFAVAASEPDSRDDDDAIKW